MLESLEQVDWGHLTHAWGPAADVPQYNRMLASGNAKERDHARNDLSNLLGHQGSRFTATAAAVPFLFEVLDNPATAERDRLIRLLVSLAVGYLEKFVPLGFDPATEFADADAVVPEDAEPEHYDDYGSEVATLWARNAYEAVLRGVASFQRLTQDRDANTRKAAVFALAWFPAAVEESISIVRRLCRSPAEPDELGNSILCLGILGRYLRDASDATWLRELLGQDTGQPVRVTAAISLAVLLGKALPPEAATVLLEAMQDEPNEQKGGSSLSWHHNGLTAHVCEVLRFLAPEPSEPVLSALCRAAEKAEFWPALNVWDTLLELVFPGKYGVQSETDPSVASGQQSLYRDPTQLTAAQRRALEAIVRNPYWKQERKSFGPHEGVLFVYGVPAHYEQLKKFLAKTESMVNNTPR